MADMADTADRILHDLRRRRDELKPLVSELERIEAAIDALERAVEPPANGTPTSPTRATRAPARRRRGRPRKGEPNRTDQFLALVRDGGTSIPVAAKELGIGPNYLYRIAATLEREGTITKQGREFVLADVQDAPSGPGADGSDLVTAEGVNEGARDLNGE
jgi:hypothetical protein